jgi:hypothetical protein
MTSLVMTASHTLVPVQPGLSERGPAVDRATGTPCMGLALAAGGALWAGLGGVVLLLFA